MPRVKRPSAFVDGVLVLFFFWLPHHVVGVGYGQIWPELRIMYFLLS